MRIEAGEIPVTSADLHGYQFRRLTVNQPEATNQGVTVAEFLQWIELLHDHTLFAIRAFHGFADVLPFSIIDTPAPFAGEDRFPRHIYPLADVRLRRNTQATDSMVPRNITTAQQRYWR